MRLTWIIAGMTSSISLTSSPILCSLPRQQGQARSSGSITISWRGRCRGKATDIPRCPWTRLGGGKITQPQGELGCIGAEALRPRAIQSPRQRRHDPAQPVVLALQREQSRSGGQARVAMTWCRKPYMESSLDRSGLASSDLRLKPFPAMELTLRRRSASSPDRTGGQVKLPASSLLVTRHRLTPTCLDIDTCPTAATD